MLSLLFDLVDAGLRPVDVGINLQIDQKVTEAPDKSRFFQPGHVKPINTHSVGAMIPITWQLCQKLLESSYLSWCKVSDT